MLFNKKMSKSAYTDFIKCIIYSALIIPALSFIGALIVNMTENPISYVSTASFAVLILSAVLGGAITAKMMSGQIKIPIFSALFITLVMMIIGLIANRGAIICSAAMNYVCYLAVYTLTAVLSRGKGKKRSKRFKHRG